VSNPFVTALVCALCVACGGIGGIITAHSAGVLSGLRASGRYVFTEPFRSPTLFVVLCVVAIVAAALWVRRLLRPRPAWAMSIAFAYIAAVIAVASIALASER
jgi:predicted permease